jgi:hypothetical protein
MGETAAYIDEEITGMERRIWQIPDLTPKLQLVATMVEKVLQVKWCCHTM